MEISDCFKNLIFIYNSKTKHDSEFLTPSMKTKNETDTEICPSRTDQHLVNTAEVAATFS